MAGLDLGADVLRDQHQTIRVVLRRPSFADLMDITIAQPRRYGAADPAVLSRLFWLLRKLPGRQHFPTSGGSSANNSAGSKPPAGQSVSTTERAELDRLAAHVTQALAGDWTWG